MKKLLVIIFLIVSCLAYGADHYVREGATGSADGSDWTNAWTDLPATLIRGDTYYIADGTSYARYDCDDAASGATYIYIKKATEGAHGTETGWNSAYGDGTAIFAGFHPTTSYWEIDGITRGSDWKTNYGFKIVTGQNSGVRVNATVSNITLKYIEIEGVGDDGLGNPANRLIYVTNSSTDINVQYCYLHDSGNQPFFFSGITNVLIEYNYIARNESMGAQHSEGLFSFNDDSYIIRHNIWEDIEGTGIIVVIGDDWEVYGNVFFRTGDPNYYGTSVGAVGGHSSYDATNVHVYNNTMVNLAGVSGGMKFYNDTTGNVAYNNMFYSNTNCTIAGITLDYNWFYNSPGAKTPGANTQNGSGDPFVNYSEFDFHLAAATNNGRDDLGSPYDVDMDGVTRGDDGVWDRGAYEYDAGSPPPLPPPPTLVMVLSGQIFWIAISINLLWSLFLTRLTYRLFRRVRECEKYSIMIERFFHDKYYQAAWLEMWHYLEDE